AMPAVDAFQELEPSLPQHRSALMFDPHAQVHGPIVDSRNVTSSHGCPPGPSQSVPGSTLPVDVSFANNGPDMFAPQRGFQQLRFQAIDDLQALDQATTSQQVEDHTIK